MIIKVIIRAAIHAKEDNKSFTLTLQRAESRARQAENTRRKNFIRRTFKKWGLFAICEINKEYPDYTSDMLPSDLLVKSKPKSKKRKPRNDFRARQLDKYELAFRITPEGTKEYNSICERIASLTYADLKRLPIKLTVTLNNEKYQYQFPWNTEEAKIKSFHALANKKGITHQELMKYREKGDSLSPERIGSAPDPALSRRNLGDSFKPGQWVSISGDI